MWATGPGLDFHLNYGDGTPPPPIIAESNAKIVIPEMPNTMYRTGRVFPLLELESGS